MIPEKWTADNRPLVWTVVNGFYNLYIHGTLKYSGMILEDFLPIYEKESKKIN